MNRTSLTAMAVSLALLSPVAGARGVSPYLPLNLSPEIERQIERVLILADKPVMSRPIAAATVLDALPAACRIDPVLCGQVRKYLNKYMRKRNIDHVSIEGAVTDVDADAVVAAPNRYGMAVDSAWQASVLAHWQLNDHAILSVGGVAYEDEATPSGTMLSLGWNYAQLDVGYRPHWFSSFTDSAMLISTEAQTLPSITLSNYTPISSWGFKYELFLAEMEYSRNIVFTEVVDGVETNRTSGKPSLGGIRLGIEPVPGWSLTANRLVQFGGGKRGGRGFREIVDALLKPSQTDNRSDSLNANQEFGNQVASLSSRFIFPGSTPFAAYLEYAGEDTSYSSNYRLGNSSLAIGITFPRLWQYFDLTFETTEWQNGWYRSTIYLDGLTNEGRVLGHWGADQRLPQDAVGARSQMLRLGWEPGFGGYLQLRGRTIENEHYTEPPGFSYQRGYDVSLSYSRALRGFTAGAELTTGRDVLGDDYSRIAGFVRFGDEWSGGGRGSWSSSSGRPPGADLFVDAGVNVNQVDVRLDDGAGNSFKTSTEYAPHFAVGARRSVSNRSDLGVRVEVDDINGDKLLAVRAIDYRYRFKNPLALTAFVGAARYDVAIPAYGYYLGAGVQWRDIFPRFDVNLDVRYADKVARDKLAPGDPPTNPRPDIFYDITSASMSLSFRF